jgi:hypothetical protein
MWTMHQRSKYEYVTKCYPHSQKTTTVHHIREVTTSKLTSTYYDLNRCALIHLILMHIPVCKISRTLRHKTGKLGE